MTASYRRLIEWIDRPSVLFRLAIAFVAAWAIFLVQVSTLDLVPPDSIDKGMYCLHALGHTLPMAMFRTLFPWLVAAQIAGVVLIGLRIAPIVCVPLVLIPFLDQSGHIVPVGYGMSGILLLPVVSAILAYW